jgi:hypothetical protein
VSEPADELTALETALRALPPAGPALDRDAVLFRAGQAAAARPRWGWPLAAAASLLAAVGLGLLHYLQPPPAPVERIVYVPVVREKVIEVAIQGAPAAAPERTPVAWNDPLSYTALRTQALRHGVESLPGPPPVSPRPDPSPDLRATAAEPAAAVPWWRNW